MHLEHLKKILYMLGSYDQVTIYIGILQLRVKSFKTRSRKKKLFIVNVNLHESNKSTLKCVINILFLKFSIYKVDEVHKWAYENFLFIFCIKCFLHKELILQLVKGFGPNFFNFVCVVFIGAYCNTLYSIVKKTT